MPELTRENQTIATVYGKPGCVQCDAAKRHMDRKGIQFQYFDVTQDENALSVVQDLGYQQVPVLVMGFEHTSGFDPDWINAHAGVVRAA